jgi:hypothetical protein
MHLGPAVTLETHWACELAIPGLQITLPGKEFMAVICSCQELVAGSNRKFSYQLLVM